MTIKRVDYMDIAKGYAIIAVVIGHSGSPFHDFIYLFHMVFFFFISGYFYKNKYSLNPITLVFRRIKSLYIPFIKYQLIFCISHNLLYSLNFYSNKFTYNGYTEKLYTLVDFRHNIIQILLFNNTERLANIFWFFTVLFEVNILFVIINYTLTKLFPKHIGILRLCIVGSLFLLGNFFSLTSTLLFNRFDITFSVLLFFLLGYYFREGEEYIKFKFVYFIFCFIFLIVSSFYSHIDLIANEYSNSFVLLSNSIIGIYFMLYIAKKTISSKMNWIKYLGINTIPIAGLHFISFKLINLMQIYIFGLPFYYLAKFPIIDGSHGWWILYSGVGVGLPLLTIYLINKLNPLNKIYNYLI